MSGLYGVVINLASVACASRKADDGDAETSRVEHDVVSSVGRPSARNLLPFRR